MQIENRVFLITGAGSGLGAAVSKMAVEAGAKVVLLDVNAEAGESGRRGAWRWRFGQIPAHADVISDTDGKAAICSSD